MSFGGAVKLTGESEYRQAIQQITQSLKQMSTALKTQATDFNKADSGMKSTAQRQKELTDALKKQQEELNKAKTAYAQYSVAVQAQTTRHNALSKEYRNAVLELEKIKAASGTTSEEYKKQAEVVDKLGAELAESTEELNESKAAMAGLKSEINSSNKIIENTTDEIDKLGKETEEAGKDAKNAGDGFTVLKGIIADLGSKAIQSAVSGLKTLGKAVLDVGKQSIESYANYEQLVGGIETLFGDSAKTVQEYAQQAYKTAGVSANTYMEQVMSFSATLLQGLSGDTEEAAKVADVAIRDMSDNANKIGTDMHMIQNAYQGFAKQNYMMLDNLKLGYGGTAAEMARLINDSGVLGDAVKVTAKTVKEVPFNKTIEAIHIIQQQIGITGTTALEAAGTIQGSAGSMKAAWQNVLTAIADENQDVGKSFDALVDSAVAAGQNLIPRVRKVVDGMKNLIGSIVTDVFPKLKREIPELAPIIDTFQWFIDNKGAVVGAIAAIVSAFAVEKIISWSKSILDGVASIGAFISKMIASKAATDADTASEVTNTAAKVAGTAATEGLTVATTTLNAAWKANVIGLVITGITALISVMAILKSKTNEQTEAEKAQQAAFDEASRKIDERIRSYEELSEAQKNAVNTGMTEVAHYSSLYDELQSIVDQNGKVKKGYEERASFITTTLANALGIEIKNVDGVIQNYNKLTEKIDEVMEKKRAQIILDSQETMFAEATKNQATALQDLLTKENELNVKRQEQAALEKKLADEKLAIAKSTDLGNNLYHQLQVARIQKEIEESKKKTAEAQKDYDKQKDLLNKYHYDIGIYEKNMAAAHEGNYDDMSTVTWEYIKNFEKAGDAEKAMLEDQIKITETNLALLKEQYKNTGDDILKSQIATAKKELAEQKKALKQYTSATETGLNENNVVWSKGLAENLSKITGANITFEKAGKGNVQMYIDGVASGEPKSKKEMAQLVTNTIKEVTNKSPEAKKAGENLIDGVNSGITNQKKQSGVFSAIARFGSSILAKLKASLQEKSPSKATDEMGQNLVEGLNVGIKKKESSVTTEVAKVGKNVLNSLKTSLSDDSIKNQVGKNFALSVIDGVNSEKKNVKKSADELAKLYVSAGKTKVDELKKSNKLTETEEVNFWNTIVANVKKGTAAYNSAVSNLNSAKKALKNDVSSVTATFVEDVKKANETLANGIADLKKTYRESVEKRQEEVVNSLKLFDTVKYDEAVDKNTLVNNLRDQVIALKQWNTELNTLRARLKNQDLLSDLEKQGVSSLKTLEQFNMMSDEELREYERLYTKKEKIAKQRAVTENQNLLTDTIVGISNLEDQASESIAKLKKTYLASLKKLGVDGSKQSKDVGSKIALGIKAGFSSGMKDVNSAVKKELKALMNSIKKELKIKSPSQVYKDEIGANLALGIGEGFSDEMKVVTKQMQSAIPTNYDVPQTITAATHSATPEFTFEEMLSAFKDALSQMKIVLDDEVAGEFVEKTVTRVIYA